MCEGPRKPISSPLSTTDSMKPVCSNPSLLLVFAATDDLPAIKRAVEVDREDLAASAPWYSRLLSGKMGFADRTLLMIAALYGSVRVLDYLLRSSPHKIDANSRSDSDGATALHLAAAGGSPSSLDAVRILIDSGADVDSVDNSDRRPGDLIAKQTARALEGILRAISSRSSSPVPAAAQDERKKEYPADLTLPDIKNGIYSTDEFRMYSFKVKPCSRAYSHDWTECPFVHPGENARRRDPRKYLYSCVPCPDFRKGSCHHGDNCEYAHGVFECWLHPAQYRTRLCKDVDGCSRRVCFFAHKEEELRSVNPTMASVNGIVPPPSPRSAGFSNLEMAAAAALLLSSPSAMSPTAVSAAMGSTGAMWSNNQAPTLQLPSSRLKASMCVRDLDAEFDLVGLESYQQKLLDEYQAAVGSPRTANYYGPQMISSPTLNSSSSSSSFGGLDHSMAKAIMNSRQAAFAKRSQSFVDRGAVARITSGFSSPQPATAAMGLSSDWGSPDRKVDWGMERDELSMLRKSASFAYRGNQPISPPKRAAPPAADEPDFSWVHSLVRDGPAGGQKLNGGTDIFSPWGEEQLVA